MTDIKNVKGNFFRQNNDFYRWREYSLNQQEKQTNLSFKPGKLSKLEFEYSDSFKNASIRLYNNHFEKQKKLKFAQEQRNYEIRAMSEPRGHKSIENKSFLDTFDQDECKI